MNLHQILGIRETGEAERAATGAKPLATVGSLLEAFEVALRYELTPGGNPLETAVAKQEFWKPVVKVERRVTTLGVEWEHRLQFYGESGTPAIVIARTQRQFGRISGSVPVDMLLGVPGWHQSWQGIFAANAQLMYVREWKGLIDAFNRFAGTNMPTQGFEENEQKLLPLIRNYVAQGLYMPQRLHV
ncbi:hypothetical protein HYV85_06190 [Candidatus Woesearchaeota archaeon]|nr:hypothetical protein [Candidatus Woesearchaeota archaeon]